MDARLQPCFAGVLMLADWLGSSIAFRHGADREATVAAELATTGWRAFTAGIDPAAVLLSLRPGQAAVLGAPLDAGSSCSRTALGVARPRPPLFVRSR